MGGRLCGLGVRHYLGIGVWLGEEVVVEIVVIGVAVFDGAEESEFLGVFGDFADVFVFEKGFSHFGEFATFGSAPGFEVVVRVGEVEVGAAFAPEETVGEVVEELGDGFLVGGALLVAGGGLVGGL